MRAISRSIRPPSRLGLVIGVGALSALLISGMWVNNWFSQIRLFLNDVYFVAAPTTSQVVLVALDETSHRVYGEALAQWPRSLYVEMIQQMQGARVIALDVLLGDSSPDDDELIRAMREARDSDARTRFVIPVIGSQQMLPAAGPLARFRQVTISETGIDVAADYLGVVNTLADVDGKVRRQFSLIVSEGEIVPSFSLAIYMAYLRIPAAAMDQVIQVGDDQLQIAEMQLNVDDEGMWLQNYFGPPASLSQSTFPVYSAFDVIEGRISPEAFTGKIVLIGLMNTSGGADLYAVPSSISGQLMAGVEIHANAVESLVQGRLPVEQNRSSQLVMIVALSLISSLLYVRLRWTIMPLMALAFIVIWLVMAFWSFSTRLEIINLFHSTLAIILPMILHLAASVAIEMNRRTQAEFLLQSLASVSHQRLVLERILPRVADDIQRITRSPQGAIWLPDNESNIACNLAYGWGGELAKQQLQTEVARVAALQQIHQDRESVILPVVWQSRTVAVISLQTRPNGFQRTTMLARLQALAREVAPSIENAVLYTRTQEQNDLLEAILRGSPAGIMVFNAELRLLRVNPAIQTAFSGSVPLGGNLVDVLDKSVLRQEDLESLQKQVQMGQPFHHEFQLGKRTFALDAARLESGFWVVILNDVSSLAELNALKTQMLRMASHDLKKPLARIVGYGSLLVDTHHSENLDEQQRQFIERILLAGEDMKQIINDILNLEQLRSRRLQFKPLDMVMLVGEVVERFRFDADLKGIAMTVELPPQPTHVSGDYVMLVLMMSNLVENAIKYTPTQGSVTIRLETPDTSVVRFEVDDTGYGIPQSAQANLFQEFFRVRTAQTADISGTGLGLALAKEITVAHRGKIDFESVEGCGSKFYVELPRLEA